MAYTVPDQYEVEPSQMHSGSYTDVVMVGTLSSSLGRFVAAFQASGSRFLAIYSSSNANITYGDVFRNQANYNIGINRFAQFFCSSETIYDSLVPNPLAIGSGALFYNSGSTQSASLDSGSPYSLTNNLKLQLGYSDLYITGSGGTVVTDTNWLSSFPFQATYSGLLRNQSLPAILTTNRTRHETTSSGDIVYNATPLTTANDPNRVSIELMSTNAGSAKVVRNLVEASGTVAIQANGLFTFIPTGWGAPKYESLFLAFFGIGDGYRNQVDFWTSGVSGSFSNSRYAYTNVVGPIIRGFKYGLYSAIPTVSKAIWRKGKFGQFRDQLEQRSFTKFYNLVGEQIRGRSIGRRTTTSAVVAVTFVSGTSDYITASNATVLNTRDSGLYNFEYCSGQPFADT